MDKSVITRYITFFDEIATYIQGDDTLSTFHTYFIAAITNPKNKKIK